MLEIFTRLIYLIDNSFFLNEVEKQNYKKELYENGFKYGLKALLNAFEKEKDYIKEFLQDILSWENAYENYILIRNQMKSNYLKKIKSMEKSENTNKDTDLELLINTI